MEFMKKIVVIVLSLFFIFSTSGGLYEGIKFTKGKAIKNNITVEYYAIGKSNREYSLIIASYDRKFKSSTSLSFYYHGFRYYLPIDDKSIPIFLNNLEEGSSLLIDIVIFNSITNDSISKNYYAYINKVRKK